MKLLGAAAALLALCTAAYAGGWQAYLFSTDKRDVIEKFFAHAHATASIARIDIYSYKDKKMSERDTAELIGRGGRIIFTGPLSKADADELRKFSSEFSINRVGVIKKDDIGYDLDVENGSVVSSELRVKGLKNPRKYKEAGAIFINENNMGEEDALFYSLARVESIGEFGKVSFFYCGCEGVRMRISSGNKYMMRIRFYSDRPSGTLPLPDAVAGYREVELERDEGEKPFTIKVSR